MIKDIEIPQADVPAIKPVVIGVVEAKPEIKPIVVGGIEIQPAEEPYVVEGIEIQPTVELRLVRDDKNKSIVEESHVTKSNEIKPVVSVPVVENNEFKHVIVKTHEVEHAILDIEPSKPVVLAQVVENNEFESIVESDVVEVYESKSVVESEPIIETNEFNSLETTSDFNSIDTTSEFNLLAINENIPQDGPLWKTYNFWIEITIFIISVIGAICISYQLLQGFLLWFFSNLISIIYFTLKKQYPLTLQQIVFLITTILGIVHNFDQIF